MKLVITTLFLPLGLVLLLIGGALWAALKLRLRTPGVLAFVLAAFSALYVFSTPVFGRAISLGLVHSVQGRDLASPQAADAIVVLTGGIYNAGPVGWLPKPESLQRLSVAYELQRLLNIRLPVIVSGGHTEGILVPSEAAVVVDAFSRMRTEITPTELEEASTDTYESAVQLAPVLAHREARNILLVTSDVHMLRSLAVFRAKGMDPIPFPVLMLPAPLGVRDFLPSVDGLKLTTQAMYEYYGLLAYLLGGRISWGDVFYTPIADAAVQVVPGAAESAGRVEIQEPVASSALGESAPLSAATVIADPAPVERVEVGPSAGGGHIPATVIEQGD